MLFKTVYVANDFLLRNTTFKATILPENRNICVAQKKESLVDRGQHEGD